jgi:hypothetical protein
LLFESRRVIEPSGGTTPITLWFNPAKPLEVNALRAGADGMVTVGVWVEEPVWPKASVTLKLAAGATPVNDAFGENEIRPVAESTV